MFAVDGSEIAVGHNKNNAAEFGIKSGSGYPSPSAGLAALYGVTNGLTADAVFTGISAGGGGHADRLLPSAALSGSCKNLLLFDRRYPSRELIRKPEDKGLSYLIRCTHSFLKCVNGCPDGDHVASGVHKGRAVSIRVIKDASGEEPHIPASSLFGEHQDAQYHRDLYCKRRPTETKYGELKTRLRPENFSGKNPMAIRQELYAALFMSNLSALVKPCAEDEIRDEPDGGKHKCRLNRSFIEGAVSRYVRHLRSLRHFRNELDRLSRRVQKEKSAIRPDRHFKRKAGHHGITNGFYIRVNL